MNITWIDTPEASLIVSRTTVNGYVNFRCEVKRGCYDAHETFSAVVTISKTGICIYKHQLKSIDVAKKMAVQIVLDELDRLAIVYKNALASILTQSKTIYPTSEAEDRSQARAEACLAWLNLPVKHGSESPSKTLCPGCGAKLNPDGSCSEFPQK